MLMLEQLARAAVKAHAENNEVDLDRALNALDGQLDEIAADRIAHEDTITAARSNYAEPSDGDIEIDDEPMLSVADEGVWVSAWVWVPVPSDD